MTQPVRRVAWFRPAPGQETAFDDTAPLAHELGRTRRVELFDARSAHDFVWMHGRDPYDVCVYELADNPAHAFVWPYLFHYPGVLRLRSAALDRGRAVALDRKQRHADFTREVAFGGWDLLRAPGQASRLVVVSDPALAARLRRDTEPAKGSAVDTPPEASSAAERLPRLAPRDRHANEQQVPRSGTHDGGMRVREVPLGYGIPGSITRLAPAGLVRFGLPAPSRLGVAHRAIERARAAGVRAELVAGAPADQIVQQSDVVLALEWPPPNGDPPIAALAGMAQASAVIVLETAGTARWPALDPQTWRSRALMGGGEPPIVISVDPRDEEHSLTLAIRRLASDPALVRRLGDAGHAWWGDHATLAHAVAGWDAALNEALSVAPPIRPEGWPSHLADDGTGRARQILKNLRVGIDFLE